MPEYKNDIKGESGFLLQNFSARSELVEDIISSKPSFMLRYSSAIFFVVILFIIGVCWFIKYPDIIYAPVKLTSINAPKQITTKTEGKLVQLFVTENDSVTKGQIVGYMESIANPKTIIDLADKLDLITHLLNNDTVDLIPSILLTYLKQSTGGIGELQQQYQTFIQAFTTFNNYLTNGFYLRKRQMLSNDERTLQKLHENLLEQRNLQIEDLSLTQRTFDANDTLKKQKIISEFDYRNETSKLLNKKLTIPQINATIINNETQQNDKQKEILELENKISEQKSIFQQALNTFISQIEEWKKKYLLTAPISGTISFATFVQKNQQLQANQTICYVNPLNSDYYAELVIPQSNFGKVKTNQEVLLKFKAYPSAEFGSVIGKISFISRIPSDSGYIAKVILPNGLLTNYKKQIQFRDGFIAEGEIIMENMSVFKKVFYNLFEQVNR
jgi:HlyD family secretion protein